MQKFLNRFDVLQSTSKSIDYTVNLGQRALRTIRIWVDNIRTIQSK